MAKFILRFDDITQDMNWSNFLKIKEVAEHYNIKSILGVVPENRDPNLSVHTNNTELTTIDFFKIIKDYSIYGDTIAQHGTYHIYTNKNSGLLGINNKSEFAGESYILQKKKLEAGKKILQHYEVWQPYFMAPSHSFDTNTLKALKELGFIAITDGYGIYPYSLEGIILVPQLFGKPTKLIPFGIQTICLHTNSMNAKSLRYLIDFLERNHKSFLNFKYVINMKPKLSFLQPIAYQSSTYSIKLLRSLKSLIK